MTPRQVSESFPAGPEGRWISLLGAALGLLLVLASLWAASAYRRALAAETGAPDFGPADPMRGAVEEGRPAPAIEPGVDPYRDSVTPIEGPAPAAEPPVSASDSRGPRQAGGAQAGLARAR